MNVNVSEIVNNKIKELDDNNVIEKAITDTFEKTILKAIDDALNSYELKRTIEKKVAEQVSSVVDQLDFQSYNSFMLEKMNQILTETLREDICQKAEQKFKDLFLCPKKEIKLSDVFKKYKDFACYQVDEDEKYNRMDEGWHFKFEVDDSYNWIECELDYENKSHRYRNDSNIAFTITRDRKNPSIGRILTLYLDGKNVKDQLKFSYLSDVELMLIQAYMNDVPITIDIESEMDIDNSFDVDY